MSESTYALDNEAAEAKSRFDALGSIFDSITLRHIDALGIRGGWRCLEVGGGGGSVARALSTRVGEQGSVLVTDINTRWMVDMPANVEVRQHDIVDGSLPQAHFDLAHARLVLMHIPKRIQVLRRLIASLRPGGWLLIEDFDPMLVGPIPGPPDQRDEAYARVKRAFRAVLTSHGSDLKWARTLARRFVRESLVEVRSEGHLEMLRGGSVGAQYEGANLSQVRDELLGAGLARVADLDTFFSALEDPGFVAALPIMISAWGRRPPA